MHVDRYGQLRQHFGCDAKRRVHDNLRCRGLLAGERSHLGEGRGVDGDRVEGDGGAGRQGDVGVAHLAGALHLIGLAAAAGVVRRGPGCARA